MYDLKHIVPGMSALIQKTVSKTDAALNYGSGALGNLLATPSYVDLMIRAAVKAVDPHLPEGLTTVGRYLEFTHEAPTLVTMSVTVVATLVSISEKCLTFEITVEDELGQVGRGKHERVIVDLKKFAGKVEERVKSVKNIPFK